MLNAIWYLQTQEFSFSENPSLQTERLDRPSVLLREASKGYCHQFLGYP